MQRSYRQSLSCLKIPKSIQVVPRQILEDRNITRVLILECRLLCRQVLLWSFKHYEY
jgi:hypothetical protein